MPLTSRKGAYTTACSSLWNLRSLTATCGGLASTASTDRAQGRRVSHLRSLNQHQSHEQRSQERIQMLNCFIQNIVSPHSALLMSEMQIGPRRGNCLSCWKTEVLAQDVFQRRYKPF